MYFSWNACVAKENDILTIVVDAFQRIDSRIDVLVERCTQELQRQGFSKYFNDCYNFLNYCKFHEAEDHCSSFANLIIFAATFG